MRTVVIVHRTPSGARRWVRNYVLDAADGAGRPVSIFTTCGEIPRAK
jgi:hypothetical protein